MKNLLLMALGAMVFIGCANDYPTNNIPAKTTHVAEEKPDKYPHPPEDLRSSVGSAGDYYYGGYYYPSRYYYNRYRYHYRYGY